MRQVGEFNPDDVAGYLKFRDKAWEICNVGMPLIDKPFLTAGSMIKMLPDLIRTRSDISVADLKLYMVMRWIVDGGVDHITADVFAATPNLMAHHEAIRTHEGVAAWNDAR